MNDFIIELTSLNSRYKLNILVNRLKASENDFLEVFGFMYHPEIKIAWKAAWACEKLSISRPGWFSDEMKQQLISTALETKHGGLLRLTLSQLLHAGLPENITVEFINCCFDWVALPKYPTAVHSLGMKLLVELCKTEPEFKNETICFLENLTETDYTPGFKSSRRAAIAKLNRL